MDAHSATAKPKLAPADPHASQAAMHTLVFVLVCAPAQLWANSRLQSVALLLVAALWAATLGLWQYRRIGLAERHNKYALLMLVLVFPSMLALELIQLLAWGSIWPLRLLCLAVFVGLGVRLLQLELQILALRVVRDGSMLDGVMLSVALSVLLALSVAHWVSEQVRHGGWDTVLALSYAASMLFFAINHATVSVNSRQHLRRRDLLFVLCNCGLALYFCLKLAQPHVQGLWLTLGSHFGLVIMAALALRFLALPPTPLPAQPAEQDQLRLRVSTALGAGLLVLTLPLALLLHAALGHAALAPGWWVTGGALCVLAAVGRLLPVLQQALQRGRLLKELALRDPLTSLYNRRWMQTPDAAWTQLAQHTSVLAFYVDVDAFKGVNDEHGHTMGDLLLCAIAKRLQHHAALWVHEQGCHARVLRVGGDEFVLLLRHTNSAWTLGQSQQMAAQLRKELARWWRLTPQESIFASASVGVKQQFGPDWALAVQHADLGMLHTKQTRRRSGPQDSRFARTPRSNVHSHTRSARTRGGRAS